MITLNTLLGFTILLSILFAIGYRRKYHRFYELIEKFSGPPTLPLIGNALEFLGNTQDIFNATEKLKIWRTPFRMWIGPKVGIVISKPEQMKTVLTAPQALDKGFFQRKIFSPWFGNSLLMAEVPIWRRHRKIVTQAFTQKILDSFLPIFVEQSRILVHCLAQESDSEKQFDLWNYISRATLDAICGTAMGTKMNSQTQDSEYLNAANSQFQLVVERGLKIWLHPDILFKCSPLYRKQCENLKIMQQFQDKIIAEKKSNLKLRRKSEEIGTMETFGFGINRKGKAFLDFLIELTENDPKWCDKDLRDEVSIFIAAGYETTATTTCYTLMALAFHQDIQSKVYEEIYEIFGDSDRDVTLEDLSRMHYLEMVIKETLRYYTIVTVIFRYLTNDLLLEDRIIPKGAHVALALRWLHHDPEIWPNPKKFDPDRFQPEEVAKRHPYAFLPLSGGSRNCIGYKYAMISMKSMLSTILRSYKITTDVKEEDFKFKLEVTTKSVDGYFVKLQRRVSDCL